MSWTRSAAVRAGLTGAAGAALVLAVLPPPGQEMQDVATEKATSATFELASGSLPIPQPLTAADIAATEAARDSLRASRASDRAELAAQQKAAKKRKAEKAAQQREQQRADRAQPRTAAPQAASTVVGERFTTTALNVRSAPNGPVLTVLGTGTTVAITDRAEGAWQQIRWDGRDAWVSIRYLSTTAPAAPATSAPAAAAGPSGAACANGSGIEGGLTSNAIAVYRAVCARYPQITGYGGYRPDGGNHGSGRAVDVMVSGSLGWDVATWLRANAGALAISEIIYAQQIWTVQRGGEGWRPMSDRGSATANHYDHVHVSVY
jgi:hypothetical protein